MCQLSHTYNSSGGHLRLFVLMSFAFSRSCTILNIVKPNAHTHIKKRIPNMYFSFVRACNYASRNAMRPPLTILCLCSLRARFNCTLHANACMFVQAIRFFSHMGKTAKCDDKVNCIATACALTSVLSDLPPGTNHFFVRRKLSERAVWIKMCACVVGEPISNNNNNNVCTACERSFIWKRCVMHRDWSSACHHTAAAVDDACSVDAISTVVEYSSCAYRRRAHKVAWRQI